jgi:alkaline phosphatase D
VDKHGVGVTPFANASSAWNSYAGSTNHDGPHAGENYYDFRYGDVAFFVLDTRRYRTDVKNENITAHTILGDKQLEALYQWLVKVRI